MIKQPRKIPRLPLCDVAEYNIFGGRTWVLVLITTAIAPWLNGPQTQAPPKGVNSDVDDASGFSAVPVPTAEQKIADLKAQIEAHRHSRRHSLSTELMCADVRSGEPVIQLRTSSSAACASQLSEGMRLTRAANPASQVVDFIDLTELARRTGRFPQLADPRDRVMDRLLIVMRGTRRLEFAVSQIQQF